MLLIWLVFGTPLLISARPGNFTLLIPTFTFPTFTTPTEPTTRPPWPSCDPAARKADVIFVFDGSSTVSREEFTQILYLMNTLPYQAPIGSNQNRFILGTYADAPKFDTFNFNTISDLATYQQEIGKIENVGYTGEPGNNIYSVLNAIVYPNLTSAVEPFRRDAAKLIVIYSSIGWDKGGMDGMPYPDPAPMVRILNAVGIDIVTIGMNQANMAELAAISGNKCAKFVNGVDDLIYYSSSMILSFVCNSKSSC